MPSVRCAIAIALVASGATVWAAPTASGSSFSPRVTPNPLDGELSFLKLSKRQSSDDNTTMPVLTSKGCYPATTTAKQMNLVLSTNGAGAQVPLCPSTSYNLNNTIILTAANQSIFTIGYPLGNTRATMNVIGPQMSVAIYGAWDQCANIQIRSVQINGNRPSLGILYGGAALIELGGNGGYQVVRDSHLYEPRGWSCLHVIEGTGLGCANAMILNNQIGPSGMSPNSAQQFRRRDTNQPGQWADGISLSCGSSTIQGNIVTDATDGGIVLFGSPGTLVTGNTVVSLNRVMLGGINMVDYAGFAGNYTGVRVTSNILMTAGNMIKVGIPIGTSTWGAVNASDFRVYNGQVTNNKFYSVNGGYFAYAIGVAGANNTFVSGNDITYAKFGGIPSQFCVGDAIPPQPASPGIVYDPWMSYGDWSGQKNALSYAPFIFPICMMESAYGSYTYPATSTTASSTAASSTQATNTAQAKAGKGSAGAASGPSNSPAPAPAPATGNSSAKSGAKANSNARRDEEVPSIDNVIRDIFDGPSPWSKRDVLEALSAQAFLQ